MTVVDTLIFVVSKTVSNNNPIAACRHKLIKNESITLLKIILRA